ncbi:hypothetical protein EC960428_0144, partial [Escherichia coli 96.0428]
MLLLGFVSRE